MAEPVAFTKEQTAENVRIAQQWADDHNSTHKDTRAHFEVLGNGNTRIWISKAGDLSRVADTKVPPISTK